MSLCTITGEHTCWCSRDLSLYMHIQYVLCHPLNGLPHMCIRLYGDLANFPLALSSVAQVSPRWCCLSLEGGHRNR